jgi:nucleoside phosphorylase
LANSIESGESAGQRSLENVRSAQRYRKITEAVGRWTVRVAKVERLKFDVGIIVPLREEYRYITEIAPLLEAIPHEGTYFYRHDFGAVSAVCCLVDQMGPVPTVHAVNRLLGFADIRLLAVLGLGGALDDDIAIGDVVIAAEVNEFQANSKAESTGGGYEVRYSGRHWPLEFRLRETISHFEFSGREGFIAWQESTSRDYSALLLTDKAKVCSAPSSLHLGAIASGNVVAASSAFVAEIKRINRKFLAIDMEAAGATFAASERIHPLPCLIIRGISDHSNEDKKILDGHGKSAWRRYSVRNAASLLRNLLAWDGFVTAAGLVPPPPTEGVEDVARTLLGQVVSCIGGAWLIGAALGLYSHGPYVGADEAVPMDLNRLRVVDRRVESLLTAAARALERTEDDAHRTGAAARLMELVKSFRMELLSPEADGLLRDFDTVVATMLCPADASENTESTLLQADRLQEENGPEAVIEMLNGLWKTDPRIRERYLDALAAANHWPAVLGVATAVEPAVLSRRELEHGLFSCAKTSRPDCAEPLMEIHKQHTDNAAQLFRRELKRQSLRTAHIPRENK